MKGSFADKIRKTMEALGGGGDGVTIDTICEAAGIVLGKSRSRVSTALRDLGRSGEVEQVSRGVYRWRGNGHKKPEIREAMWKLLRARRVVDVDDLQELAGASRKYAEEWLRTLDRHGVVRKLRAGRYQLVKDRVAMPVPDDNTMKLREIRAKRKAAALDALARAEAAITEAKIAIEEIELE